MSDPRTQRIFRQYVKTSQVKASPMSFFDYLKYNDQACQPDEENKPGFIVLTPCFNQGGTYSTSWVDDEEFQSCFKPIEDMSFGNAMTMLEKGFGVARRQWGWNVYLMIVNSDDFFVSMKGVKTTPPWIGLHRVNEAIEPYSPSHMDMTATDWAVLGIIKTEKDSRRIDKGDNK